MKVYEPTVKADKDAQLHESNSCVTLKAVLLFVDRASDAELLVSKAP